MSQLQPLNIDWRKIFDQLDDDEPDLKKARALHRIATGMTQSRVAAELDVSPDIVKTWVHDPRFQTALQTIRQNLESYLTDRLQLRISQADDYMDWILSVDLDRVLKEQTLPVALKKELIKEKGLAGRQIYQNILPKRTETTHTLKLTLPNLNLTPSAQKLLEQEVPEIIDGTIIDAEKKTPEDTDA